MDLAVLNHGPSGGVERAALPPTVRDGLRPVRDTAEAEAFARRLVREHYENFTVVSFLLPKRLRQDFCNIYAFCRVADDAGDELGDAAASLALLGQLKDQVRQCFAGHSTSAVFTALSATIRRHDIPIDPFLDLIDAFEQDQRINRYDTFEQLREYCRRSANPVGRLVLYLCGHRDAERQSLSDQTCTALQLANHLQDVRRDFLDRDRVYLPREDMDRFGVSEAHFRAGRCDDAFREMMRFEVGRSEKMFNAGDGLLPMLDPGVRKQVALFAAGGRAILGAIRRQNFDTLSRRPRLSAWQKGRLALAAFTGVGAGANAHLAKGEGGR